MFPILVITKWSVCYYNRLVKTVTTYIEEFEWVLTVERYKKIPLDLSDRVCPGYGSHWSPDHMILESLEAKNKLTSVGELHSNGMIGCSINAYRFRREAIAGEEIVVVEELK